MPPTDGDGGTIIGIPTAWLAPLRELVALYREYGSLPRAVFSLIATYLVSSVFGFGSWIVASVLSVFDMVTLALAWVQVQLSSAFAFVGIDILGALRWVQLELAAGAQAAGPLAPLVTIAIGSIALAVTYRALIALVGELPGGSSLVDFLGLR
ncbi:hypothetical protein [Halosimplex halobium]|uniref:hypothetical protein n=1 Tax=Halosimplex halobium TaxID=3396618 RepID=UPI003F55B066